MKLICLDAGHGGSDPGATGNGLQEKEITLQVAKLTRLYIANHYEGAKCYLTRDTDKTVSLSDRTRTANAKQCDCLVSIHVNSAGDTRANGFESFVYTTDGPGTKSANLQNCLHKPLSDLWQRYGRKDRGQKRANFHMVREFKGASVLIELGFIVNGKDATLLESGQFLSENAAAIGDGIAKHLGLTKKQPLPDRTYRVNIEGAQVGAFANSDNILAQVADAVKQGKRG